MSNGLKFVHYDGRDLVSFRDLLLVLTGAGLITEAQVEEIKAARDKEVESFYANLRASTNAPRRRWWHSRLKR